MRLGRGAERRRTRFLSITGLPWRIRQSPSIDKVGAAPSGTDNCQVSVHHIDELRQAVDPRPAKKRTDSSDGRLSPEPAGSLQGMAFGTESKQLKFFPLSPLREHRPGLSNLMASATMTISGKVTAIKTTAIKRSLTRAIASTEGSV